MSGAPMSGAPMSGGLMPAPVLRPVLPSDAERWCTLRTALWPETSAAAHAIEIARFFWCGDDHTTCVVADTPDGIVGFAELSIRSCTEWCVADRIGYLEGWYVTPGWQRRGIGRALVRASEAWARAQGCREFASDTTLDNAISQAVHRALGFREAERIVCYSKPLLDSPSTRPQPATVR